MRRGGKERTYAHKTIPCPDGLCDVLSVRLLDGAPLPGLVGVVGEHVVAWDRLLFQERQLLVRKDCEEGKKEKPGMGGEVEDSLFSPGKKPRQWSLLLFPLSKIGENSLTGQKGKPRPDIGALDPLQVTFTFPTMRII